MRKFVYTTDLMKANCLIFSFLFAFNFLHAQDTLVKQSGDTLAVILLEVNPENLRYKRFDYQNGPTFTVFKQEIKFVIYANGKRETFEHPVFPLRLKQSSDVDLSIQTSGKYFFYKDIRIAEADMLAIVSKQKDKKLDEMVRKVNDLRFLQHATGLVSIPLFVSGFFIYAANRPQPARRGRPPVNTASRAQSRKNGGYMMIGALVSGLASVSFMIDRRRHDRFVVHAYNAYLAGQ